MYLKKEFGNIGENIATKYLESLDYKIIARNFKCKMGEIGYNVYKGGGGPNTYVYDDSSMEEVFSREAREKMSQSAKNREHPPTTDGRVGYTNGDDYRMIKVKDIPRYESKGWWHGTPDRCKHREPPNKGKKGMQVSEKKGKITIHYPGLPEIKNKFIPISEYEFYYTQGWIRGSRIFKNCIL